jgi:transcriptional regulator with XRE-family HTH domain
MTTVVSYPEVQTIDWPSVIRHFRLSRNMKQSALASDLGVTQTMISRWEGGAVKPSRRVQEQLFDMFWNIGATAQRTTWMMRARRHPNVVGLINAGGIQIIASRGLLRQFEANRHDLEGQHMSKLYGSDMLELYEILLESGFFAGRVATAETIDRVEIKKPDGTNASFLAHGLHRPMFMKDQQIYWLASGAIVSEAAALAVEAKIGGKLVVRKAI